jgi:hypothetical protein
MGKRMQSNQVPSSSMLCNRHGRSPRERGVFAVMFAMLLLLILAFCGLALHAGQLYNRKVDLNGMAKAAAMAAARELNGSDAGIATAKLRAREVAEALKYQYFSDGINFSWDDAALTFGKTPARSGEWVSAPTGGSPASSLYFAKVDTAALGAATGEINTFLLGILSSTLQTVRLTDSAVAGRTAVNVTPIAICAMATSEAAKITHTNAATGATLAELVQYGFRRGVSYDLMQLNPAASTPARYLANAVLAPGASGPAFTPNSAKAFMCGGTMWVPRVTGGDIRVSPLPSDSPLASLFPALNSRFDLYVDSPCDPIGAPPDLNIKAYAYDVTGTVTWMTPSKGAASAAPAGTTNRRETVADVQAAPGAPGDYGPLWAYAKAAKAPNPLNATEPTGGFPTFTTSDWPTLYKGGPTSASYASSTPYLSTSTTTGYYLAPQGDNLEISMPQRRVLNIPLLSCSPSAPSGSNVPATVVGIGKFFMTVPADKDKLIAEFAGLLPEQSLTGPVELFP